MGYHADAKGNQEKVSDKPKIPSQHSRAKSIRIKSKYQKKLDNKNNRKKNEPWLPPDCMKCVFYLYHITFLQVFILRKALRILFIGIPVRL
jgi:hypothetical protein